MGIQAKYSNVHWTNASPEREERGARDLHGSLQPKIHEMATWCYQCCDLTSGLKNGLL